MESDKCANTLNGCTRKSTDGDNSLNDIAVTGGTQALISLQRTDSALSGESIASSRTSTKSPNSISSRHVHPNETPSNHHYHRHRHHQQQPQNHQQQSQDHHPHQQQSQNHQHHQQQSQDHHHHHHHHHHQQQQQQQQQHYQSQANASNQHLKRSANSSCATSATNSLPSSQRMDESASVIGINSNSGVGATQHEAGTTTATATAATTTTATTTTATTTTAATTTATTTTAIKPSTTTGGKNNDNNTSLRKAIIIGKEQQQNANKKKQLSGKEIEELAIGLRKLNLAAENALVEQFIKSNFENDEVGGAVGQMLVHFSIEDNRQAGKVVARIAAQLLNVDTASVFHQGVVVALMHYFECRDRLRIDHFRVWITFLNFVSDLYASVGYIYEGELVDLIFRIFGYLLKAPVLDTLKIEELESLIGCLLSVGYDLERQCPEQLAILRDLIRDAFIEVQEPWARKMILLLMELGASGWKLPSEANEYYFQHTSS